MVQRTKKSRLVAVVRLCQIQVAKPGRFFFRDVFRIYGRMARRQAFFVCLILASCKLNCNYINRCF